MAATGAPDENAPLEAYSAACGILAERELAAATRFGQEGMRVTAKRATRTGFVATVRHTIRAAVQRHYVPGAASPGSADLALASSADFEHAIEALVRAEDSRAETPLELAAHTSKHGFGVIDSERVMRTHPRRIMHAESCRPCKGVGRTGCSNCGGKGEVKCPSCHGDRRIKCFACYGRGSVIRTITASGTTYSVNEQCTQCVSGYNDCFKCTLGYVKCDPCGGTGAIRCAPCNGSGKITQIAAVETWVRPEFVPEYPQDAPPKLHEAITKAGWPTLASVAQVRFRATRIDGRSVYATFLAEVSYCELNVSLQGETATWVLFGEPPRVHDTERLIERLVDGDFRRLTDLASRWRRLTPWFARAATAAISQFMSSNLHERMVASSTPQLNVSRVESELGGLLRGHYIIQSMRALEAVVRARVSWAKPWALLCVAACSLVFTLAFAIAVKQWHPSILVRGSAIWGQPREILAVTALGIPVAIGVWQLWRRSLRNKLRKAGGERLLAWAEAQGIFRSAWLLLSMLVAAMLVSFAFGTALYS